MALGNDRDNIFHERISVLKNLGYNGYTVTKEEQNWNGVQVTVENENGRKVSADGETIEEAYTKLIDNIDLSLDDHF